MPDNNPAKEISLLTLQERKLRLKQEITCSKITRKWWRQDVNPGTLAPELYSCLPLGVLKVPKTKGIDGLCTL